MRSGIQLLVSIVLVSRSSSNGRTGSSVNLGVDVALLLLLELCGGQVRLLGVGFVAACNFVVGGDVLPSGVAIDPASVENVAVIS